LLERLRQQTEEIEPPVTLKGRKPLLTLFPEGERASWNLGKLESGRRGFN
jgi:hypothetical protein